MIRHIVTITLKDDAPAGEIEAFFEELGPISRHPKAIAYHLPRPLPTPRDHESDRAALERHRLRRGHALRRKGPGRRLAPAGELIAEF